MERHSAHIKAAARKATQFEGQIAQVEAELLVWLASQVPAEQVIVEIGSYRGRSAIALALGSLLGNGVRVYAVDPHLDFTGVKGGEFGPSDMARLYRNLDVAGVGRIVAVVALPSVMIGRAWFESDEWNNVGLLWIDGDHRYEAVRDDFETWAPCVAVGGWLAFHDSLAPGVGRLLAEIDGLAGFEKKGLCRQVTWYQRVGS